MDNYNWHCIDHVFIILLLLHATRLRFLVYFEDDVYSPLFPRIKEYDCIVYTVGLGINLLRYNYTTDRILREEKLNVVYDSGFSYIAIKSSNFTYAPTG